LAALRKAPLPLLARALTKDLIKTLSLNYIGRAKARIKTVEKLERPPRCR